MRTVMLAQQRIAIYKFSHLAGARKLAADVTYSFEQIIDSVVQGEAAIARVGGYLYAN